MYKKRGQVTIFLMLAAMILVSGIVYFSYQKTMPTFEEQVKPEFIPVKTFAVECIKKSADEGIKRIGMTGGYIEYPAAFSNPRSYLEVLKGSGFRNPYWWYDGISAIPDDSFIKSQLESYIKKESLLCISGFESIKDEFDVEIKGGMKVDVLLNEEDITVKMTYPVRVKRTDKTETTIKEFAYKSNTRLKKAHELAKSIMESENADGFIEQRTFDLMALTPEDDIPINGFESALPCISKKWQIPKIKERLKELLSVNLPYIKIKGTDFSADTFVPNPCTIKENNDKAICRASDEKEKDTYGSTYYGRHYVWDIGKNTADAQQKYSGMKVGLRMAEDFTKFEARPREGAILKSKTQGIVRVPVLSRLACFNIWHFTYDIAYPVLVTIYDKQTQKNDEFVFNFAFKTNIDHNYPKRENTGIVSLESDSGISDEEYCNDAAKGTTILRTKSETSEAVEDAELSFSCGPYNCNLGRTEYSLSGDTSGIIKGLPRCASAIVTASKEGFIDGKASVVSDNKDRIYEIEMKSVKEFPKCYTNGECTSFKVVKHAMKRPAPTTLLSDTTKIQFTVETQFKELKETDEEAAIIVLKEKGTDFESSTVFPFNKDHPLLVLKNTNTKYDVEIYMTKDELITGAYKSVWSPLTSDVENSKELVFHAISFDQLPASSPEEKDDEFAVFLDSLEEFSKKIPMPELK